MSVFAERSAANTKNDIFVINDIDLTVPPSQININQEDLLYNWKTLRTGVATKIATGHGQVKIHVSMQFTNAMMLDMHRLFVELRHSPFCRIQNKYLRDSLVPDWPGYQQMAFTMTSIHASPLPGTSDAWNVELDLLWFNYFPYLHNYLFREDWHTNWLSQGDNLSSSGRVKLSIGWDLDPDSHEKKIRLSTIDSDSQGAVEATDQMTWNALDDQYDNLNRATIFDLERFHFGESFDLLPLPGNMEPSAYVLDPRNSRIYTRFINYLQRDALIKNFGFNPEEMLGDLSPAFFAAVKEKNLIKTYGLHSGHVPREIRSDWISRMLRYNSSLTFYFHNYKDIRLPSKYTQLARENKKNAIGSVVPNTPQGTQKILEIEDSLGNITKGYEVRNGWWDPVGKFTPVGLDAASGIPMTIAEILPRITSRVSVRTAAKDAVLYGKDSRLKNKTKGSRLHKGTDIGVPVGTPIFAVAPGKVILANEGIMGEGVRWEYFDSVSPGRNRGLVTESLDIMQDWENSVTDYNTNGATVKYGGYFGPTLSDRSKQKIGTLVASKNSTRWYYPTYTAGGQQLTIHHDDGSQSKYMHLHSINVAVGQRVQPGQLVGASGNTASFQDDYIDALINYSQTNPESFSRFKTGDNDRNYFVDPDFPDEDFPHSGSPYSLSPHLHFEYHEARDIAAPSTSVSGFAPADTSGSATVIVDPVVSWEAALDKSRPDIVGVTYPNQINKSIETNLENGVIQEEDEESLRDLLTLLNEQGWVYYEEDGSISNLWYKNLEITVANQTQPGPSHSNQDIVLANASGGLRHVVANIPILSHEYPTQQHLGSIEPVYNVEFIVNDQELDSISNTAALIQSMRSLLQANARKFRPVVDAWCVGVDTFMTRMIGSYRHNDVATRPISTLGFESPPGFLTKDLTKRFSIMRSNAHTVPGHPGVSTISMEVAETNPFEFEKLQPKAIDRVDLDAARKEVLQKLYSLDFLDTLGANSLAYIIAKEANANVLDPEAHDYGVVDIPLFGSNTDTLPDDLGNVFRYQGESSGAVEQIMIKDVTGFYGALVREIGKDLTDDARSTYGPSADFPGYATVPSDFISLDRSTTSQGEQNSITDITGTTFNLSEWLTLEDGFDANGIDFTKIMTYWQSVIDLKHYSERMLAEHSSKGRFVSYILNAELQAPDDEAEGLSDKEISNELFGLPYDAKMWRSWQEFIISKAAYQAGSAAASEIRTSNSWLVWRQPLDGRTKAEVQLTAADDLFGLLTMGRSGSANQFLQNMSVRSALDTAISLSGIAGAEAARQRIINTALVSEYMDSFQTQQQFDVLLDNFSYNQIFSNLLGYDDEANSPRGFEFFKKNFEQNLIASGYFQASTYAQVPEFVSAADRESVTAEEKSSVQRETEIIGLNSVTGYALKSTLPQLRVLDAVGITSEEPVKATGFVWIVSKAAEIQKVAIFKAAYAQIADRILQDPDALEILGLVELGDLTRRGRLVGTSAYPDIDLPFHPFFGNALAVDPDFYMWNIYDDGGALSLEIQDQVKDSIGLVLDNCYQSLQQKQKAQEIDPKVSIDKGIVLEPDITGSDGLKIKLRYAAEGTDNSTYGPMGSPFTDYSLSKSGEGNFISDSHQKNKIVQDMTTQFYEGTNSTETVSVNTGTSSSADALASNKVSVRLSNSEGYVNANVAGGLHYPRKMTDQQYREAGIEIEKIQKMFGTKQGYQEQNILSDNSDIGARNSDTLLGRPDEFVHAFNPGHLKKLAIDSSKDIVSQRMTMKRAYPTFKLFFVEEDEVESRTLNFDDFHSYNAVQSFNVELSRKSPADHAVITLQNVSGTLDGTRRDAIVDLDYFTEEVGGKLNELESALSNDPLNKDTSSDQPFSSIVLRPGMNVQLRAGYANDPDSLSVLVSGRVVDIHWNKNGDLAEILVQSFGTELVQVIKGTHRNGEGQIFATTHQLLGSLMLEPELAHFGRWEIGQLFQAGEAKDARLDFKDYNRDQFMERFTYTSKIAQWTMDHPLLTAAFVGSTGGLVLSPLAGLAALESTDVVNKIQDYTLGSIKRFFTQQQVSLFLSPQDDNLYPPHPKDYMTLDQPWLEEMSDWVAGKLTATLGINSIPGKVLNTTYRWWNFERLVLSKKVLPADAEYQLLSTTIWKVFHEMSLRHPGWVYGARPYGNEFRYTMFFGVPSQRYWARGASNSFIKRMNDLHDFLDKAPSLSEDALVVQYKQLFGAIPDEETLKEDLIRAAQEADSIGFVGNPLDGTLIDETEYSARLHQALTGEAMREYLRGLNFRFVPFRRYHLFSSDRNLVWNGLLSAENAVTNAVDVTYFNNEGTTADQNNSPVASVLFKAHSFIPENKLRVAPIRYRNCKGYNMAMRYGMGELIHRMKDMYRGEIIITGNARVRPWDIGILVDSYNDMVGPIEVERVVHTFSHETGFVTEIKPSALVIGNEISSWPLLEAMQTFSLAVLDIENNYLNLKGASGIPDSGNIKDVAEFLVNWQSDDLNDYLKNKNPDVFGKTLDDLAFGGSAVNSDFVDSLIGQAESVTQVTGSLLTATAGAAAIDAGTALLSAASIVSAPQGGIGNQIINQGAKAAGRSASNVVRGGLKLSSKIDFPGLAWLIGGPILFLQCLRQDSVIVVPLMKNGNPIVSGLNYHDPTMLWSSFRGDIRQFVDDVIDGTRDLIGEYKQYGTYMWNNVKLDQFTTDRQALVDSADLRGGF